MTLGTVDQSPEELDLSKLAENPRAYIEDLDANGKLGKFFPAFSITKGVTQSADRHVEGDVFVHTLMTFDKLRQETPSDKEFEPIENDHDLLLITLALLYHDTGKKERNAHDRPDHRVFHVEESAKHARADLAQYLSEEDLEIVIEMIKKHENLLDAEHISPKINKLHKLFALRGKTNKGRLLLKFAECDLYGRKVAESHQRLVGRGNLLAERNVKLLRLLQEQEAEGLLFPIQHISGPTRERIKRLIRESV